MRNRRIALHCGLLVVALWTRAAWGQALVDHVPDGAIIYAGWSGTQAIGADYDTSHLKAILEASDISKLATEFIPKIFEKVGQKDPNALEVGRLLQAIVAPMWKHPTAVYFEGIDFGPKGPPTPKLEMMCDAGADGPELLKQVQTAMKNAGPSNVPMNVTEQGGLVRLTIGYPNTAGGKLADSAAFKAALAKVHAKPVGVIFVNGDALVKLIAAGVQQSPDPQARRHWTDLRTSLGLDGFKSAIWTVAFEDKNWGSRGFVSAPAPRMGLLKAFDCPPLPDEAYKVIPETATLAGAFQFDLAGAFDGIQSFIEAVTPEKASDFENGGQMVSSMLGLDVRNDLLAPIGNVWSYYIDPSTGGNGILGGVLVNKLRDPAKAEQSLNTLEQSLNRIIKQQMHNKDVTIAFKQSTINGVPVHYLAVPFVSPSWTIKDGKWIIGLYPQIVVSAAGAMSPNSKSILDNPTFVDLKKRLGDVPASSMQFADLPKLAPTAYSSWLLISRYVGFGDVLGIDSPLMLLPTMNVLQQHLSAAGTVTWSTDEGLFVRSICPFPASETLSADPMFSMGVAEPALLVSILLPSLNKARETANRVKCASNLKQIGNAMILYANENHGAAPPDLGTLIAAEGLTESVFICPSGTASPPKASSGKPEDTAKWASEEGAYIYLKPGKPLAALGPDVIVVYERFENHGDVGINVLFADGHVDFFMLKTARKLIDDQVQGTGQ